MEVVQCHRCRALHFNADRRCPECNAGLYYQCWGTDKDGKKLQTPENVAAAYREEAERANQRAAFYEMRANAAAAATPLGDGEGAR